MIPIQSGNEVICPCGCGVVVLVVDELPIQKTFPSNHSSINMLLLGSAIEKNVKYSQRRTRDQLYEEQILRRISDIVNEFSLPERFIIETFNNMKKNKRGFRSETEYMKQLIKILSKDDNYPFIKKLRKIKERYENIRHN